MPPETPSEKPLREWTEGERRKLTHLLERCVAVAGEHEENLYMAQNSLTKFTALIGKLVAEKCAPFFDDSAQLLIVYRTLDVLVHSELERILATREGAPLPNLSLLILQSYLNIAMPVALDVWYQQRQGVPPEESLSRQIGASRFAAEQALESIEIAGKPTLSLRAPSAEPIRPPYVQKPVPAFKPQIPVLPEELTRMQRFREWFKNFWQDWISS